MPFTNGAIPANTISWTEEMENYLKDNYTKLTNKQLANGLGLKLTAVRMKLYSMGLKRMELEYWTEEQIIFLVVRYHLVGDVELAEYFNKRWAKAKGWTLKHIEKKRRYLKLKRTPTEVRNIQQRNVDNGRFRICAVKRWLATGVAKENEIRMWRNTNGRFTPMIKINDRFIHGNRWAWEKAFGPVPKGLNVVYKDDNPNNTSLENLELVTNAELSKRNSEKSSQGLSFNYVAGIMTHGDPELREHIKKNPKLIELKRQQLLLNRSIYEQERNTAEA